MAALADGPDLATHGAVRLVHRRRKESARELGHAVLALEGEPVFDPHPSDAMLDGPVEDYTIVVPVVQPIQSTPGGPDDEKT